MHCILMICLYILYQTDCPMHILTKRMAAFCIKALPFNTDQSEEVVWPKYCPASQE